MRYFTVSSRGRKGYNYNELGLMYQLDVDLFGKYHDFYIHADNRKEAIETAKLIVSTITYETTAKDIQTEVNKQNGLQQLRIAYRMLETHEDKDKVYNYIQRLKVHFNIAEEESTPETMQITPEAIETTPEESNEQTEEHTNETTYTAYNRSFDSYSDAYNYCIDSDFDPSYIEAIASSIVSELPHKLDLQLFAESQPMVKKSNATYKDGVWKSGIGRHLELIYTVETTKHDNEADINFSNIHKYHFSNIQSAIDRINIFQSHGYKNLQLWTEVHHKGNTIIENGTHSELEYCINSGLSKDRRRL